jgi:hypothetical protein
LRTRKLFVLTLLALLFLGLSANVVLAAWTPGAASAGWIRTDRTNWKTTDSGNSEYMEHENTPVGNFQLWSGTVTRNDSSLGGWWTISQDQQWTNIEVEDVGTTHSVRVWVEHWSKLFLFSQITKKTSFQIFLDGQAQYFEAPYVMGYHTEVEFYIYRNTSDLVGVSVFMDDMKWSKTLDVGSGWFTSTTLSQRIDKNMDLGATGYITGRLLEETLIFGGTGGYSDPLEGIQPLTWVEGMIAKLLGFAGYVGGVIFGSPVESRSFYINLTAPTNGAYSLAPGFINVQSEIPYFSVKAIPNAGYHFDYWLVNGTNMIGDNPLRLTINGDTVVLGIFGAGAPPSIVSPASMVTLLVPGIIIGGIGGAFWKLGDHMGDHGLAGFLIGGAMGMVLCAVGGLISMWIMTLVFVLGFIGFYLWYGGGG